MMRAIILCGGKGSRISDLAQGKPKNLLELKDKSILQYQLDCLEACDFDEVYLIAGFGIDAMNEFVNNYQGKLQINLVLDTDLTGTGNALKFCKNYIDDETFLIMGDLLIDFDFKKMLKENSDSKSLVVCHTHPSNHIFDSDSVNIDSENFISKINFKGQETNITNNLTLSGIFLLSKEFINLPNLIFNGDFTKNILNSLLVEGLRVKSYKSADFVKDVGTLDRFGWAEKIINFKKFGGHHNKRAAIFLDRDGTINESNGYIKTFDDLTIFPGNAEGISKLNELGYLLFVTTNQPILARGEIDSQDLNQIHNLLEIELAKDNAFIDEIHYCPHHPDSGFEGEKLDLKIDCECRKPRTGMVDKLTEKYSIDLNNSWVVGDSWRDEKLAENLNINYSKITMQHTNIEKLEFKNILDFANYLELKNAYTN